MGSFWLLFVRWDESTTKGISIKHYLIHPSSSCHREKTNNNHDVSCQRYIVISMRVYHYQDLATNKAQCVITSTLTALWRLSHALCHQSFNSFQRRELDEINDKCSWNLPQLRHVRLFSLHRALVHRYILYVSYVQLIISTRGITFLNCMPTTYSIGMDILG